MVRCLESSFRHGCRNPEPWTVTSRLHKHLIQHYCRPQVCHPWTLDSGILAGMTHPTVKVATWVKLSCVGLPRSGLSKVAGGFIPRRRRKILRRVAMLERPLRERPAGRLAIVATRRNARRILPGVETPGYPQMPLHGFALAAPLNLVAVASSMGIMAGHPGTRRAHGALLRIFCATISWGVRPAKSQTHLPGSAHPAPARRTVARCRRRRRRCAGASRRAAGRSGAPVGAAATPPRP